MKFSLIAITLLSTAVHGFEIDRRTAVVLPEKPESSSELAATELQEYVRKASGIRLSGE